ncbi:sulfotransferase domain-containing protein [Neobacillus mesonae]|uniref:sulfotransferase domain-containing protein n=1 Tax=Neobacillus mesonae TaxID=1193713 RepID=UPI00257472F2|nr:sulfotransferase domain-containing protein [Neobacillus mesonae]
MGLNISQSQSLSPFLLSSVPKSGTHLLHQLLIGMPDVFMDINDESKKFFLSIGMNQRKKLIDHRNRLKKLSANEFGFGHVVFSNQYAALLQELNMKHVFIYRDPRDVLVSLSYFIKDLWVDHPLHFAFNTKYLTTKSRMLVLLRKGKLPFYRGYEPYYRWSNHKNTFSLSYEDLMISKESREQKLRDLVNYLWEDSPPIPLNDIINKMEQNIDPKSSYTFRKGKIGNWKDEFDDEMKQIFKKQAGQLLITYGFEKDNNW